MAQPVESHDDAFDDEAQMHAASNKVSLTVGRHSVCLRRGWRSAAPTPTERKR